jgi:hypothetical protein
LVLPDTVERLDTSSRGIKIFLLQSSWHLAFSSTGRTTDSVIR